MTPDTVSSRAAMRAEVPTDRPSARWERVGCGCSEDTTVKQGETTMPTVVIFSPRSVNMHIAARIHT